MSRHFIPGSPISLPKRFPGEHNSWRAMRNRCINPKNPSWKYYGAKGIRFCEQWASFADFLEDMGPKPSPEHSIDRADRNGYYEPGNCRWATPQEQGRNTSKSSWLTHAGRTLCLAEWAGEAGIGASTIEARINDFGWSVAEALTTPPEMGRNRWSKK